MSWWPKNDDAEALLEVAKAANQIDWEYKPTVWGEPEEPPISEQKVVAQLPEIQFPVGNVTFPSTEYVLTMPWIDIVDAEHIVAFQPKVVQRLLKRLIEAEATVERVEALCDEIGEGKSFGILAFDREPEYPISYFQEALRVALDEL